MFVENYADTKTLIQRANLMQILHRDNDKDDC